MTHDNTVLTKVIDCRLSKPQPTEEELAQTIYEAVLHCIQYKAKAIEAAEQFNKEREQHQ